VIAGTTVVLAWIHAHLLQLRVELARARFNALWAGLGFTGDPPAKRRRATPVSSARAADLRMHASKTMRSPVNDSDLNGATTLLPSLFSHSSDPLDVDDWLKTVTKKLEIAQCTDSEMVLYAAGRLVGLAGDWWDAYATAHPNRQNITWQEFRENFRTYHIPSRVIKLK
jgi:hypothetical protein